MPTSAPLHGQGIPAAGCRTHRPPGQHQAVARNVGGPCSITGWKSGIAVAEKLGDLGRIRLTRLPRQQQACLDTAPNPRVPARWLRSTAPGAAPYASAWIPAAQARSPASQGRASAAGRLPVNRARLLCRSDWRRPSVSYSLLAHFGRQPPASYSQHCADRVRRRVPRSATEEQTPIPTSGWSLRGTC